MRLRRKRPEDIPKIRQTNAALLRGFESGEIEGAAQDADGQWSAPPISILQWTRKQVDAGLMTEPTALKQWEEAARKMGMM